MLSPTYSTVFPLAHSASFHACPIGSNASVVNAVPKCERVEGGLASQAVLTKEASKAGAEQLDRKGIQRLAWGFDDSSKKPSSV